MTNKPFSKLIQLYRNMDDQWDSVAKAYTFECNGCKDNCCTSLFYHHTHVEKAFLLHGFKQLPSKKQKMILVLAKAYCDKTFANGNVSQSLKILCPANEDGRCLLYAFRPMICRLHGLPHELNRPGFETIKGPGCAAGLFDKKDYVPFDRTPFYQQMAQIEMTFRQSNNLTQKIKLTIAHILLQN